MQHQSDSQVELTAVARERVAQVIRPGDRAVDATAGNGCDTLFLCGQVGPAGQILAIDLQSAALAKVSQRWQGLPDEARVGMACPKLIQGDHRQLTQLIPADWLGSVRVIMFNLGYLPGGDKGVTTQPASTLAAIQQALTCLHPAGLLSILAYTGHPGGLAETSAVEEFLQQLTPDWQVSEPCPIRNRKHPPRLFLVQGREIRLPFDSAADRTPQESDQSEP